MPRILIAGGAGFIGSNLANNLLKVGNEIVIVDNLATGSYENIRTIVGDRCEFIEIDVRSVSSISNLKVKGSFDWIINLACIASPKFYYASPVETLLTSIMGTKNLLDMARSTGSRFLQASTSEIYGDPEFEILKEEYNGNVNCTGPRACYDEGKRAAETLCVDYMRQYGSDIKIIRIFNTYGPKMALLDGRAIPEFVYHALKNEDIIINGTGCQTRSFMYIDDLIEAINKILKYEGKINQPINIGNPFQEYSIKELAEKIIEMTNAKSKILFREKLQDDPRRRRPDISRAEELLGWYPEISLDKGLSKYIEYVSSENGFN